MATNFTIQDHHVLGFTKLVELLLQQTSSVLMGAVSTGSYMGDAAQVVLQFGEVEFQTNAEANWKGDTPWSDLSHEQRWVMPSDWDLGLAVVKEDQLRMLVDPKNPYASAMKAAYQRLCDKLIVAAAFSATAKVGKYDDMQNVALPAGQTIAAGSTGLTLDKLIQASEMLAAAHNDPSDPRYVVCSQRQISDLLRDTKVTSSDYSVVKALVSGQIDTYMGFTFLKYEGLPKTAAVRSCIAYAKSGLHLGTWNGLEVHIDQRPDKKYVWQIYGKCTLGATRTQEKKVIKLDVTE